MSMPPTVPFAPAMPGELLLGRYRVERVLGAGGMGVVVAALHVELGQRVAVKFLNPNVLEDAGAVARFTREARAAVRIKSDHVARVMDVGRLDNGAPYMVMEYLEGEDLAARVQRGPLPLTEAVDYLVQVCDAMAEAHVEGIIHRDLKPANLFLVARTDGSASVKVLDFGISKLVMPDAGDVNLTRTATLMGSPLYMSPEQLKSARDVDLRADVWSLGVILFELLTGRPPFSAATFAELVSVILNEPAPRIGAERHDVPAELERAVQRCLEKAPERRFQNVGELAAAIVAFGSDRSRVTTERVLRVVSAGLSRSSRPPLPSSPPSTPPKVEASVPTAPGHVATGTSWAGGTRRDRRRGYALVFAGVAVAGALAAALFLGVHTTKERPPPALAGSVPPPSHAAALTAPHADRVAAVVVAPPSEITSFAPAAASAPLARMETGAPPASKVTVAAPRPPRPASSTASSAPVHKTLTLDLK